jgi:nuclear-control-of-ATPase protein 2
VSEDAELSYEHELEWLLLSKAAAQTYGQVLNAILDQTLALNTHLSYWDDILGSHQYAGLYSLQTSPIRLWAWSKAIIFDVRSRQGGLTEGWRQFYGLVQDAVRERSIADLQARAVSPLSLVRKEATQKQKELKQIKEINANALGVLLGEGLGSEDEGISTPVAAQQSSRQHGEKWKSNVAKSIVLMEAVLSHTKDPEADVETFEEQISSTTRADHYYSMERNGGLTSGNLRPRDVSIRLQTLLRSGLPDYKISFQQMLSTSGRPSRLVRYWLPATVLVLSSSTILRIALNRKAEILTWIQEFGGTVRDFWTNWVVEPTRKVIGTIRHDEGSEVAIMSKRSLEGDRESLERMVVEFAVDENRSLSEVQIQDIKAKVREGDLTSVLMAYEKDLKKPFLGAVKGNLIRALLIQIQKTKVDVEVAMGGIDSLLKSQELVFGYVQWLN